MHEMIGIHVRGGTGAGVKRPLKERRWMHWCGATRPATPAEADEAYWSGTAVALGARMLTLYSCPHCGTRRPSTDAGSGAPAYPTKACRTVLEAEEPKAPHDLSFD